MSRVITHTTSQGMPVAIEPMSGVRSIGLTWLVPAGSATDPEDRQGVCAMLSELILRGAGDLDSRAQADALDRLGISRSVDPSTYHLRLGFALTGDRLIEALPLIVDMVRRPHMDAASIEPTRDLCLQALESLADDPAQRATVAARERHNEWPLNRSGLGTREGLTAISRDDLLAHWGRQARPESSILAVAGDLSDHRIDEFVRALDRLLNGWTGAAPAIDRRPPTARGTYHHLADKSAQVQIVLVHDAPAERSPDSRFERIVSSVLSGGMSCRLFSEIREKRGLCYSVSQGYATERDYGRCLAYVGTTPERAQESLDVLVAELHRTCTRDGCITRDELDRALIGLKSSIVLSGESSGSRASALAGDIHRLGRPRTLEEIAAQYSSITLDEVNAYLSRRKTGPATIVTLGPAELKAPVWQG